MFNRQLVDHPLILAISMLLSFDPGRGRRRAFLDPKNSVHSRLLAVHWSREVAALGNRASGRRMPLKVVAFAELYHKFVPKATPSVRIDMALGNFAIHGREKMSFRQRLLLQQLGAWQEGYKGCSPTIQNGNLVNQQGLSSLISVVSHSWHAASNADQYAELKLVGMWFPFG
jgi:hypothetical protein